MDRGRECVFVGHNDKTIRQHWVYAPDLGRAEILKTVDYDEKRKGGDLNLQIKQPGGVLSQDSPYHYFPSSSPPIRNLIKNIKRHTNFSSTPSPHMTSNNPLATSALDTQDKLNTDIRNIKEKNLYTASIS